MSRRFAVAACAFLAGAHLRASDLPQRPVFGAVWAAATVLLLFWNIREESRP